MKRLILLFTTILLLVNGCDLDGFLFNTEPVDSYNLPGNTIPENLIEEVTLESGGNTLYGYWIASPGDRPELTILYCHGNKHNIDEYWDRVMMLHELGGNIFIFDYRGFGRSEGEPSEAGLHADGEAALAYVTERADVNPDSLVLYGYSLGNVVSIYLASHRIDPLCLIAEAPFASSTSLVQGSSVLDLQARWLTDGEFDNAGNIREINTPFLLFHGEDDDFVRYRDNGKVVFNNAPNPKRRYVIPDAVHNNVPQTMGIPLYLERIEEWIEIAAATP